MKRRDLVLTIYTLLLSVFSFCYSAQTLTPAGRTSFREQVRQDSIEAADDRLGDYCSILNMNAHLVSDVLIVGPEFNLLFRLGPRSNTLLGMQAMYSLAGLVYGHRLPHNTTYKLNSYTLGIRLLARMRKRNFFSLAASLLLGKEEFNEKRSLNASGAYQFSTTTKTLEGTQIEVGFCNMPLNNMGFYYGADLLIRTSSSDIVSSGLGPKVNIGIRF